MEPAFDYARELKQVVTVGGESKETKYGKHDQFAPEFVHFSRCILEDLEPEPSADEGIADVRVLEAVSASARSGKTVLLEPFRRRRYPSIDLLQVKPPVQKPETVHAPSPSVK